MAVIRLTLSGEEAVFSWKDGRVYAEGYDLESEKAVLALTGYGDGIGVLLVASNDCCKSEAEFRSEIKKFVVEQKVILDLTYWEWPKGQLLFEYFSYSSDSYLRWGGMESARLSERHYKRILKDPEMFKKVMMARLQQLPEKYFHTLLNLSLWGINCELALNKSCPSDVLEILSKDKNVDVRRYVARNSSCPESLLEILAKDKGGLIREAVANNPSCPEKLLGILARDTSKTVRVAAGKKLSRSRGLEV